MSSWFIVKGLGPFLDGKLVQGEYCNLRDDENSPFDQVINVTKIVDRDVVFGDRNLSFIMPKDSMLIFTKYLVKIDDPKLREFDSKNPWGKQIEEFRTRNGDLELVSAQFERCLTVTVIDHSAGYTKTIYSNNFMKDIDDIRKLIHEGARGDLEELIFELKRK